MHYKSLATGMNKIIITIIRNVNDTKLIGYLLGQNFRYFREK